MARTGAPKGAATPHRGRKVPSKNQHRFESFSSRIAAINVKPFRLNEAERRQHAELSDKDSHFKVCLDKWRDQNMSTVFTAFSEEVDPYCQSLTQTVHHRTKVVDLLLQSIEKKDVHSLEPLLELLVRLADDLWLRFDEFFERCIAVVADVAATHTEVEGVEWSFDAMTGLFKRFARLLERNLVPLFTLMAPMLGKERQKSHVTRFSAEAMSFLIRRTASVDDQDASPLDSLINFALNDLYETPEPQQTQYQLGLMAMFADAIKNSQSGVRECGVNIVSSLLKYVFVAASHSHERKSTIAREHLQGVLISLIHHTNSDSFEPISTQVLSQCRMAVGNDNCPGNIVVAAHLLYTMAGVRKGSRLSSSSWTQLLKVIEFLISTQDDEFSQDADCAEAILASLALFMQYAPLEIVSPRVATLLQNVENGVFKPFILRFCVLVNDLGRDRFTSLLSSPMRRYIMNNWNDSEATILALLPSTGSTFEDSVRLAFATRTLEDRCDKLLDSLANGRTLDASDLHLLDAQLDILMRLAPSNNFKISSKMSSVLQQSIILALKSDASIISANGLEFLYGRGLECFLRFGHQEDLLRLDFSQIVEATDRRQYSIGHLNALRVVCEDQERLHSLSNNHLDRLLASLEANLATASQELRRTTLELLIVILEGRHEHEAARALKQALEVESMTLDPRNIRVISQMVRRLGHLAVKATSVSWLKRVVAAHCLGLLFIRLTPMWDDAISVLNQCCDSSVAADLVMGIIVSWLQCPEVETKKTSMQHQAADKEPPKRMNEFQCSHLLLLDAKADQNNDYFSDIGRHLRQRFDSHNSQISLAVDIGRSKALLVLEKLPRLAERNSKVIVPVFLEWFSLDEDSSNVNEYHDDDDEMPSLVNTQSHRHVSREDRKGLLRVFSNFENPKMLPDADRVKETLMSLLCSGDAMLQKPALEALLAWRESSIQPYADNLINLLDDTRFRDELIVFLHVDDDESVIKQQHWPALLPVLLRMLYGRAIARTGSNDRGGLVTRRKAVLTSLARLDGDALEEFVRIALDPLHNVEAVKKTNPRSLNEVALTKANVPWSKQIGLAKMVQDMAATLSNKLAPMADRLMDAAMFCFASAQRSLSNDVLEQQDHDTSRTGAMKATRQEALRAIQALFEACSNHDWTLYKPLVATEVIAPRVRDLAAENAQGVSTLFRIFSSWAANSNTLDLLLHPSHRVYYRLADSLSQSVLKDEVRLFILNNIIQPSLCLIDPGSMMTDDEDANVTSLRKELLNGLATTILEAVGSLLSQDPSKDILEASLSAVELTQPFVGAEGSGGSFVKALIVLIDPARKHMNHVARTKLLGVLESYLPRCQLRVNDDLFSLSYDVLSSLFSYFQDWPSRQLLGRVFKLLTNSEEALHSIAVLCECLNRRSSTRLGETDMGAMDEAFAACAGGSSVDMSARQWQPLLHNFLFLVEDDTNLSPTRAGASRCLRSFTQCLTQPDNPSTELFWSLTRRQLVETILFPGVVRGIRHQSETIRGEYLTLLEELTKNNASECADMRVLLEGKDYPSFFAAIHAVQHSQRLNAWRKLALEAHNLESRTISRIFVPLIETVIAQVTEKNLNLVNEAVTALKTVVESLTWSQFRSMLQRMVVERKRFETKLSIRVLGAVVDAFHRARLHKSSSSERISRLAQSMPGPEVISQTLGKTVLSKLMDFLHYKNEVTVDLRVPVATIAAKVIVALPDDEVIFQAPHLLLDLCNVLKSKAQEARDAARISLSEVTVLFGPGNFRFVLTQLKSTLSRGAQQHVLSYTVQYLLRTFLPHLKPGDLHHCLQDLVAIVIDNVFGHISEEKEATDYKSRTKEVNSPNKGYDIFAHMATIIAPDDVSILIDPLRQQLNRSQSAHDKVKQLLERARKAISHNESFLSSGSLTALQPIIIDTVIERRASILGSFALKTITAICKGANGDAYIREAHRELEHLVRFSLVGEHSLEAHQLAKILSRTVIVEVDQSRLLADILDGAKRVWLGEWDVRVKRTAMDAATTAINNKSGLTLTVGQFKKDCNTIALNASIALANDQDAEESGLLEIACKFLWAVLGRGVAVLGDKNSGLHALAVEARGAGLGCASVLAGRCWDDCLRGDDGGPPVALVHQSVCWLVGKVVPGVLTPAQETWARDRLVWMAEVFPGEVSGTALRLIRPQQ
ncbi:MAG: hypothetical protein Q9162_005178 [Coniocarpon cinnabarinum]